MYEAFKVELPEITDNIATSRDAVRLLERCLPGSWPTSSPKEGDDYGIDIDVFITEGARALGRRAHIQVKGTRQKEGQARFFRMKQSTLNYLRDHADIAIIARIQVDEQQYWLININDIRTLAEPSADGYVSIIATGEDEVQAENVARVVNALSYRQRLADYGYVFAIITHPSSAAVNLHTMFHTRLPRELSFIPTDDGFGHCQALLELPEESGKIATLHDRATACKHQVRMDSAAAFLLDLALFLAVFNAGKLAAEIVLSSVDLLAEGNIGNLSSLYDRILHNACSTFGPPAEITRFVGFILMTGERWAGQWAVNFAFKRCLTLDAHMVSEIAKCMPVSFATKLLQVKLLLVASDRETARTFLQEIVPPERDGAEYFFEYAQLCELFEQYDAARSAWFRAARNGYDTISCHLEVARSFLVSGRVSDALRFTPRSGMAKDERGVSVLVLLRFIRLVLTSASRADRESFDVALNHNDTIVQMIGNSMQVEEGKAASGFMFQLALLLVAAFRANENASAKTWASALVLAVRARVHYFVIDAIVAMSSAAHGGQPLRLAASILGPAEAAILRKWHLVAEDNRGAQIFRRTEDFIDGRQKLDKASKP